MNLLDFKNKLIKGKELGGEVAPQGGCCPGQRISSHQDKTPDMVISRSQTPPEACPRNVQPQPKVKAEFPCL